MLDAPALFAVAYGEIGSSIYFALGIVAAQALGLTPVVLLLTGALFLVVSLSYAEGTAAIPETGGAATFTRRAFNDLSGFVTGWVLFLDYLIVIALSALFVPHYLARRSRAPSLRDEPWDVVVAAASSPAIVAVRLVRHSPIHRGALALAVLDLAVQALLVVLGFALLFSPETLDERLRLLHRAGLGRPRVRAAARDARVHRARDGRQPRARRRASPGRALPRSLFSAIGLVVVVTVADRRRSASRAFPAEDGSTALGDEWLKAPLVGIVTAFDGQLPGVVVDVLRSWSGSRAR